VILEDGEARRALIACDAIRLRELLRREVRAPDRTHLARRDELVENPERLGNRCLGIGLVQVVEIDVIRSQSLERTVNCLPNALRRAVSAIGAPTELGRKHDSVSAFLEDLSKEALASVVDPVQLGGIEERDSGVERGIDDESCCVEIDPATKVVAAEPDAGDAQAAAIELDELHVANASWPLPAIGRCARPAWA